MVDPDTVKFGGAIVAIGAVAYTVFSDEATAAMESVQDSTSVTSADPPSDSGGSDSSSSTTSGTVTDFDSSAFEDLQVESAQTTISSIESGLIDPVETDDGETLDDASSYIGHTGL